MNSDKASATNVGPPATSPHISISFGSATATGGWYTAPVTATLSSGGDGASLSSSLDGGAFHAGTTVSVTGDGLHTLDVRSSDGSGATFAIPIDTAAPTISIFSPVDGSYVLVGSTVPALYSCSDSGSGLAATNGCVGTVAVGSKIDTTTQATKTFTVTAKDAVGHTRSLTVSYRVWKTPGEAVLALIDKTLLYLKATPLNATLKAGLSGVVTALAANHQPAACLALNLYIALVNGAPSSSLTAAQKADLVADATRIKVLIGCP